MASASRRQNRKAKDVLIGVAGPIVISDFMDYLDRAGVCQNLPVGLGGTPVNLLSLELLKRGHQLVIFTLDPRVDTELVLEGKQLKISLGPYRPKRARDFFRLERDVMEKAIRRERPTLVHAQWTYEFALAAIAAEVPHIVTAHDAPFQVLRHNFIPYRIARTLMAMKAIKQTEYIAAVAPHVAKHLERFFFPRRRVDVIPNGLPNSIFDDRVWSRKPKSGVFTFFTILNGWGGLKNGQIAIQAFAKLGEAYRPARLVMLGAGHDPGGPAELWACEHGLAEGIEFAGSVAYEILQNRISKECDILVHPALEEAHPMAIIEALAKAVPVIGGKSVGGVPWTLDFGEAGMLVDVRSPEQVANAMLKLVQDSELRQRLSEAGHRRARRHFSIEAVADAYERKYEEILNER